MDFEYRTKPIRAEAVHWSLDMDPYDLPHWFWGALDRTHKRTHGKIAKIGDRFAGFDCGRHCYG